MDEQIINQRVAEQICSAGRFNGTQFQWGDCVALLDGQVVAFAKNLHEALQALRRLDANPKRGMVIEVSPQVTDVIR